MAWYYNPASKWKAADWVFESSVLNNEPLKKRRISAIYTSFLKFSGLRILLEEGEGGDSRE